MPVIVLFPKYSLLVLPWGISMCMVGCRSPSGQCCPHGVNMEPLWRVNVHGDPYLSSGPVRSKASTGPAAR